jgi:hypothetical protein
MFTKSNLNSQAARSTGWVDSPQRGGIIIDASIVHCKQQIERNEGHSMSAATADFVAKTGDTIQFTFTPQTSGFAFLAGASLTVEASGAYTPLTVASNQA